MVKGMTSDSVTSQCVLKLYEEGEIEMVNKSEPQKLSQFAAHFISKTDQTQACNFATFNPFEEQTPLHRAEWIKFLGSFANLEVKANQVFDTELCPVIKNVLLLDYDGKRVAVKYFSDDWTANSAKLAFEKSVFRKTVKTNARAEDKMHEVSRQV